MRCCVCKHKQKNFLYHEIISPDLAKTWKLSSGQIEKFNHRESDFCRQCGCSLRSRILAEAIMLSFPDSNAMYFLDWVEWAKTKELTIAEINYCGQLHPYLAKIPGIKTSQFYEHTLRARVANFLKGIRTEDITNLSYKPNQFDLALHSEVLEHVDDTEKALSECRRILKPGGICLFTVPIIMNRKTKRKAHINHKTGSIKFYGTPSHHGGGEKDNLVFWEFGGDMIKTHNLKIIHSDPANYTWIMKLVK